MCMICKQYGLNLHDDGSPSISSLKLNIEAINTSVISRSLGQIDATATPTPGSLSGTEDADIIEFELVAGQTYTFDYRGTPGPGGVEDPYLAIFGPGFTYITEDDDGGFGRSSLITITAAVSGTYSLYVTSYYTLATGDPGIDTGDYVINVWSPEADVPGSTNVLASIPTAVEISVGTTFGNMEAVGDNDYFAIDVTAGMVYTFSYAGGVWGAGDRDGEPGENLGRITLYNASGTSLGTNFNYESGLSYFATADTTIYLRAQSLEGTGGYTLDVAEIDPSTRDPLDSIRWKSADNIDTVNVGGVQTAYVYFAPAGENFGEKADNGIDPMITYGWTAAQQAAVMSALGEYTKITGIQYLVTTDVNQAEFRMLTTNSAVYGARFYPQDPAYGTQQGIGTFNLLSGGFGADPNSLLPGGYSYEVILHEFGHAHGLAHPHDTGGGSDIMLGVTTSTGSYGVYDLNQGVYTVMSYNSGWITHPDGVRNYSAANRTSGWNSTLGAFDIAVLQERYGVHASNTGDTVYTIADTQATAKYQTVWDTGGTDTINYVGSKNVQIDLLAATLDYTPTGGGVVSFAHDVWGGFTIANGVVIENATGGSGNDVLLGNSAANVLTGNGGKDVLIGRGGNDTVIGGDGLDVVTLGAGDDKFVAEIGATKMATKAGTMSVDIITDFDRDGNDLIDLSGLGQAFNFRGTSANKNDGDLTYKTYDSINGAENALGFDIDGNPGASGVSGPVTVVFGNVDGGKPDFAIVLLGTSNVSADDFIYG